jgi:hypothetical protein
VVKLKLAPVAMVPLRLGRGWGERGLVLGVLGGVHAVMVMPGIGWIVVGKETIGDNGIMAILRIWVGGGEAQGGHDTRPQEVNPPVQNVVNPSMEPTTGNLAPNSTPAVYKNLAKVVVSDDTHGVGVGYDVAGCSKDVVQGGVMM